ncbi:hypothetical protein ACRN9O_22290 [Shewanella oncorhynchi]|uniref:hypothetical protein n=1 Tax=Shewanella oncorhynchi TaxID=2726434 RepID=UPI003D7B76DF
MNKLNEQNKTAEKETSNAKTGQVKPEVTATHSQTAKVTTHDKAKLEAGINKDTENKKPDAFKGKWPSQVQAAKANWSKISEAELIKSNGNEANLTELVKQHYSLNQDMASKQVTSFIDKCHC